KPSAPGIGAMQRAVHRGIKRQVEAPDLLVDDWPQLIRPGVKRILRLLPSDLLRHTDADGPMPVLGNAKARPYVSPNEVPPDTRLDVTEQVKSGFKERVETVSDLQCFVELVVCRIDTVHEILRALDGEVRMELEHGASGSESFRRVDLDFVIALGRQARREKAGNEPGKYKAHRHSSRL